MKNKKMTCRRKGALTMELILIFPMLLLLFFLFFQVSMMLVTYHSLQTTATHAALEATTASSLAEITTVVNAGLKSWYYKKSTTDLAPATSDNWGSSNLQFRILKQNGSKWNYVTSDTDLTSSTNIMVEIKLANMQTAFPRLWIVKQFKGVTESEDAFYVSAMGRRLQ